MKTGNDKRYLFFQFYGFTAPVCHINSILFTYLIFLFKNPFKIIIIKYIDSKTFDRYNCHVEVFINSKNREEIK